VDHLAKLKTDQIKCQFGLHQKRRPGGPYNPAAFMDMTGYQKALAELQAHYDKKIKWK
jgi:metallo-beta-lactamase class B